MSDLPTGPKPEALRFAADTLQRIQAMLYDANAPTDRRQDLTDVITWMHEQAAARDGATPALYGAEPGPAS